MLVGEIDGEACKGELAGEKGELRVGDVDL